MLVGQDRAHALTHEMEPLVEQRAIGPGEINELEQASRVLARLHWQVRDEAVRVDLDDFAGLDFAHEVGADGHKRAAFGSDDPAPGKLADAKRTHSLGIAYRVELVFGQNDETVRAIQARHCLTQFRHHVRRQGQAQSSEPAPRCRLW